MQRKYGYTHEFHVTHLRKIPRTLWEYICVNTCTYIYNHIYILYPISKQATRFRPFMTLSVKPRPREFASTMGDSTPPGKSTKRYGNPWVFYESDLQSCWVSISISFYIYVNLQEGSGVRVYTGGIWSSRLFQTGVLKKENTAISTCKHPKFAQERGQHSANIQPT